MDPITTNTLNKNNVYTTRYFNNGTIYADFIKTSDGQLVNVKDTASEIELEDIRDDIMNINTYLGDLNTKYNDLKGDVDLMSIDIQTDLFTPLYTNSNELTRMTALTSYINNTTPNVNHTYDKFTYNMYYSQITKLNAYDTMNLKIGGQYNENLPELSNDAFFAVIEISKGFTTVDKEILGPHFNLKLNLTSLNGINCNSKNLRIYYPDKLVDMSGTVFMLNEVSSNNASMTNNTTISSLTLLFRKALKYNQNAFRNICDTQTFLTAKLDIVLLSEYFPSTYDNPTDTVRYYCRNLYTGNSTNIKYSRLYVNGIWNWLLFKQGSATDHREILPRTDSTLICGNFRYLSPALFPGYQITDTVYTDFSSAGSDILFYSTDPNFTTKVRYFISLMD